MYLWVVLITPQQQRFTIVNSKLNSIEICIVPIPLRDYAACVKYFRACIMFITRAYIMAYLPSPL